MKVAGVYLAAGNSSRMGSPKLALPIGEKSLGSLALETALRSPLDEVYVITKESDQTNWISPDLLSNPACKVVTCGASYKGQSESLRCGIKQAIANKADAVLVMLADQPFITVTMLKEMIDFMKTHKTCRFAAASLDQTIMPPVLFSSTMFSQLLELQGDKGARAILKGDFLRQGKLFPCTDKRTLFDIDTMDDFTEILTSLSNEVT